jgi:hypothetical protein
MSSRNTKDHAPLCLFTFSDGRRCRTPRTGNHPHFCFDHAQKEARARTTETIGKDLAYFFSSDYLSANDLSAALARLIPAVVRGDIKPKTAPTVAYLAQTLLQSIRLAQHEYINALGTNGWRNAICNSVSGNHDHLYPPQPAPQPQPAPPSLQVAGLQTGAVPAPQSAAAQPPQPAAPAAVSLNVGAGLQPGPHLQPAPPNRQPASTPPRPTPPPVNCHSEGSEEPAFSSSSVSSPAPLPVSQTPASTSNASHIPAARPVPSSASTVQPINPPPPRPSAPPPPPATPDRNAHWLEWDNIHGVRRCNKLL